MAWVGSSRGVIIMKYQLHKEAVHQNVQEGNIVDILELMNWCKNLLQKEITIGQMQYGYDKDNCMVAHIKTRKDLCSKDVVIITPKIESL